MALATLPGLTATADDELNSLLQAARDLRPRLIETAAATELAGRVSPEMTRKLVELGLHRFTQPKRFGGGQFPPSALFRLGYELGRGCISTAWCSMIANGSAWLKAYWPLQAQEDIWARHRENLIGGVTIPTGKCRLVDGGYLVHGRWGFSSNCDNSDWCFVSARLPDALDVPQGFGWFIIPSSDINIDQDSWNVVGMKGTGSKTLYADEPVFVPRHRMIRFDDIINNKMPGRDVPGNAMAQYDFWSFGPTQLIGPIVGAAQGALDWFCENMREKVKTSYLSTGATIAENPEAQAVAGDAQTRIDAAVALVLTALDAAEAHVREGREVPLTDGFRIRRSVVFAARQSYEVVNMIFKLSGASAGRADSPLQRIWRDVSVATNHATLDIFGVYRAAGEQFFGLNAKNAK